MENKAYINLNTLRQNVKAIKKKLNKNQKFCAVVKADAYGHGASQIANAIYMQADCFAVALVQEGVRLRLSGIQKDILVLIPPMLEDIDLAIRYDLTLVVDDFKILKKIEHSSAVQGKRTKIHIKYNCGMNRLGVDSLQELNILAKKISQSKHLYLDGTFSHVHDPQNKKCLINAQNNFLLANNLIKGYNNRAICHLEASGGFLSGVKSDMARIGLLMYGYYPFNINTVAVKPIMKVYAPIIKTRKLKKHDSCLYGDYSLDKDDEVCLVRYGYADGLNRQMISGQINNRCMDITALSKLKIKSTGRGVVVMDNADSLAKQFNTISYEVLTKVAIRANKIYLQ